MNAENANLTGTLNVGESLTVEGTLTGGTIKGAEITGGSININDKFTVNSNGRLVCTSANIGGWEVKDTSTGGFTYPAGNFSVTPTGLNFNNMLKVASNGKTTIKDLVVTDTAHFDSCKVGINTTPSANYDLYVGGKSVLGGNVGIGVTPSDDYKVYISGKILLGGQITTISNDTYETAINGSFKVDGSGLFDPVTLKFRNGLLVGLTGASGGDATISTIPSVTG